MTTTAETPAIHSSDDGGKGLKPGALGLVSSVVIGVASTAPAYSLAATMGLIVALVGLQAPAIVLIAFIPIFLVSIGYQQLNKREPDCGTTFTWATKAFGPKAGWMGGWGIIAADVLVMASLAQVAGLPHLLQPDDVGLVPGDHRRDALRGQLTVHADAAVDVVRDEPDRRRFGREEDFHAG